MRLGLGGLVLLLATMVLAASRFSSLGGQSVSFYPGTTQVRDDPATVDQLADWLATFPEATSVQVRGYYCAYDRTAKTSDTDLLYLAENRAIKLRGLLVERGLDRQRIATIAYGTDGGASSCQATAVPYLGQ